MTKIMSIKNLSFQFENSPIKAPKPTRTDFLTSQSIRPILIVQPCSAFYLFLCGIQKMDTIN